MERPIPGTHICVVGSAQTDQDNPIFYNDRKIILVLLVERETGLIVECDCNMVCGLTREFIRTIFVRKQLVEEFEEIRSCILSNYFGSSVRAVVRAAQSARSRLIDCLKADT